MTWSWIIKPICFAFFYATVFVKWNSLNLNIHGVFSRKVKFILNQWLFDITIKSCCCRPMSPEVVCPHPLLLGCCSSAAARRWLNCITKWPLIHYEFDDFWKNTLNMQLRSSPNDLASCNVIAHFNYRWLINWGKEWTGWWVLVVQSFTYRSLKPWSEVTFAHNSFKISDFVLTVCVAI